MLSAEIKQAYTFARALDEASADGIAAVLNGISNFAEFNSVRLLPGKSNDPQVVANWIAVMYRIAMVEEALGLGTKFVHHIAPTLVSRLSDLVTAAFGDSQSIEDSLTQACKPALGPGASLNVRKRKGEFSMLLKAMRFLSERRLPVHWANIASACIAQKDLFGVQAILPSDPQFHQQQLLIPASESQRLIEAEQILRGVQTLCILDVKNFYTTPGLLATSRIHATLKGETPVEIQLWIKGYLLPMRSYWYFRHKRFAIGTPPLDGPGEEARVRCYRDLELEELHGAAKELLFNELLDTIAR